MPKVSIIVPAFNVENFIENMLVAIKNQLYDDYEVLMINDGSTDSTAEIMEKYCLADKRFKLHNQENQGVSAARNKGLNLAQGKYVVFYDADDYVPKSALDYLVAAAEAGNADITIGKFKISRIYESNIIKSTGRLSRRENIDRFDTDLLWNFSVCNKMFKREAIEDLKLRFDQRLHITEDGLFLIHFIQHCQKICGCPAVVYEYCKRPFWEEASATQDVSEELIHNTYQAFKRLEAIIIKSVETDPGLDYQSPGAQRQDICARLTYRSTLYKRFAKSDLLAGYYRTLWLGNKELCLPLAEYLNNCKKEMFPSMWEQIVEQNFELRLEEGIKSREEAAADPTVTIVLTKDLPNEGINDIINSCYKQEMPFFELLAAPELGPYIEDAYKEKENFHIVKSEEDFLQQTKGLYVMVISQEIWFVGNTLKAMLKAFRENEAAQCVSIPIMKLEDGKLKPAGKKAQKKRKGISSNMLFISGFLAYNNPSNTNWCAMETDGSFMLNKPKK